MDDQTKLYLLSRETPAGPIRRAFSAEEGAELDVEPADGARRFVGRGAPGNRTHGVARQR